MGPYSLERRKHRQRESGYLNRASDNVREDEHEHANLPALNDCYCNMGASAAHLPPPPSVWWSAGFTFLLVILENVRLPLKGQAKALNTGGQQAHENADLQNAYISKGSSAGDAGYRTATLPCGERSPSCPIPKTHTFENQ